MNFVWTSEMKQTTDPNLPCVKKKPLKFIIEYILASNIGPHLSIFKKNYNLQKF